MNVTALKAMIKHWKSMMAAILAIRAEVRKRLARHGEGWTVGELHMFSGVALSVPAFHLMKGGGSSPQPPLHPILSSMFRITDGIRMTTHEMIFLSEERTRDPGEPVTASELYGFAERNGTFLAGAGVCAGPRAMIDEFFTTVFDGTPVQGTEGLVQPPEVQDVLAQLPVAVDYALLGLQSWSVSRSVWLAMSRAYKALRELFQTLGDAGLCGRLRARLEADWPRVHQQRIALDYERDVHLTVYADLYEQAWHALGSPATPRTLAERIAPCPETLLHATAAKQLRGILHERFGGELGSATVDQIVAILILYLREEQAILASTTEIQCSINELLSRPTPARSLTARDLRVVFVMYGGSIAKFPYLFDMLESELAVRVEATAATIEITDLRAGLPESAHQHHVGTSSGA